MFEARVLSTSTSYNHNDLPVRREYEVQVRMGGNPIGMYVGENDFEDVYDWAVHEIKWSDDEKKSVDIGHDYAYDIASAVTEVAGQAGIPA